VTPHSDKTVEMTDSLYNNVHGC